MKVRIDAGGREVEIDCADTNTTPREVAAEALAIWKATGGNDGVGYGFTAGGGMTTGAGRHPAGYADLKGRPLHVTSEETG